jgi:hypothetical protein
VSRYFVYKQALLDEAERLVQADVLGEKEDIFFLTVPELHDVVRTHQVDEQLIRRRKDAFRSHQALTPPGCSHPTAKSSPGQTDATMCRPVRWLAYPLLPGPAKGERESSWT